MADRYHVIAPGTLGYGLSDAPSVDDFDYAFDAMTDLTESLLRDLGVDKYAMYVQDYGAPIGWRLALRNPSAIAAIITQNGNAYDAGFVENFWTAVRAYKDQPTPETEAPLQQFLTLDATRWQYVAGVPDETLLNPEAWHHDYALLSRPGNDAVQLTMFRDYASNSPLYPRVHEYFRTSSVPLLAAWGRGDEIFGPAGAEAFRADLPDADIHLLQGGHFLLEPALDEVTDLVRTFMAKVHPTGRRDMA